MNISRHHWWQLLLGGLVTVGCLYWAVSGIEWADVRRGFSQARFETIPVYLLLLWVFYWLKAIRWKQLVSPVKEVPVRKIAAPMMIGFMANNLLPARLGEVFRVLVLSRQEQISVAAVVSSVAIERLLDVFALLVLVTIGMLQVREVPESFQQAFLAVGLMALVGVLVLIAGLIWLKQAVLLAEWCIRRLPVSATIQQKLQELVAAAAIGTTALKNGRLLGLLLLNSVVQWGCNGLMIAVSLWSFGIHVPFSASLILLGVLAFAVSIPSTPGFFGAIQLAFVKTLALFAVADGIAFAASIYYHLIQYLAVTAVGLWYVWKSGMNLTRLKQDAEHLDEAEALATASSTLPTSETAATPPPQTDH